MFKITTFICNAGNYNLSLVWNNFDFLRSDEVLFFLLQNRGKKRKLNKSPFRINLGQSLHLLLYIEGH